MTLPICLSFDVCVWVWNSSLHNKNFTFLPQHVRPTIVTYINNGAPENLVIYTFYPHFYHDQAWSGDAQSDQCGALQGMGRIQCWLSCHCCGMDRSPDYGVGMGLMLVIVSCCFGIYRSVENGPPSYWWHVVHEVEYLYYGLYCLTSIVRNRKKTCFLLYGPKR